MTTAYPELGCYGLAGHSDTPRDLVGECLQAEELGLGAVFLSERFNLKDAGALAGAAAAVTGRIGIGTAATNPNTRHPLVTATLAATAYGLSEGRYAFGLGRGFDALFDLMGVPRVTSAQLKDAVTVLRTLWRGETVAGYDGPLGQLPYLSQGRVAGDIPVLMTAIGERSLALAGRLADGVVLHTFLTDQALARSVRIVREAAAGAGRDPHSVRIWAVLATVTDSLDEQTRARKLVGRLATYLQGYGSVLVGANGWDPAVLDAFRAHPLVRGYPGAFDAIGTTDELHRLRDEVIPAEWLAASATGTAGRCAQRVLDQFDAGADSVILHGATPDELAPVIEAWRGDSARPRPSPLAGVRARWSASAHPRSASRCCGCCAEPAFRRSTLRQRLR